MSKPFTFLHQHNVQYLDSLYQSYLKDPFSVDETFRIFFEGVDFARSAEGVGGGEIDRHYKIFQLLRGYRRYGHLEAHINPLQQQRPAPCPYLSLDHYGLSDKELSQDFPTLGLLPEKNAPLQKIIDRLRALYCSTVGLESTLIDCPETMDTIYEAFQHRFEAPFSPEEKKSFYRRTVESEELEIFINKTYPYITRFSIEGGESFLSMVIDMVNRACEMGVEEIVVGMAHRGRINLLANVMGKPLSEVFYEFESTYLPSTDLCNDLKYHNGLVRDVKLTSDKTVKMTLISNPSHLESVDPVIAGATKARQTLLGEAQKVLPLAIHGDAAFAGQGVVYETMQMSRVRGFEVGGTLHIVVNNQIGYTAGPDESRSTYYSTEIARAFSYPVFHVNGEDIEGCIRSMRQALEIRQTYGIDVIIDYNCYRRIGHNEADEVSYTHPVDYKFIKQKPLISEIYKEQLFKENILDAATVESMKKEVIARLEKAHAETKAMTERTMKEPIHFDLLKPVDTRVEESILFDLFERARRIPHDFHLNPKLKRILDAREQILTAPKEQPLIDWGFAETLAFASLLDRGIDVRLTGQDSIRGTFSSRHAALYDYETQQPYFPLEHLSDKQGRFTICNNILSEFACLGFELGYSMVHKGGLTLWEAQYGDFFNGAQIIFDQYISSLYDKWEDTSALTVLLPHAMEGKGSEHSSARLERHLQMASKDNMLIAYPSTAGQYFHLLRRQAIRQPGVPLIVMTPKSHLRFQPSFSSVKDLTQKSFEEVLDDPNQPHNARRLILCSGHVYYDLTKKREELKLEQEIAIIRIEQLYPLHRDKITRILESYSQAKEYLWVQEEHRNQGACDHMFTYFRETLNDRYPFRYVGRPASPVPAAGYSILHYRELETLLNEAIA
ncbi:MAG: 2-oxoglutarate dehydrogenase E1 component [Simkaniaceae bacterium]|nr:2-oxoglutarate dehydrogenase E1 component [Simkaniaceae bacterium]MCF7853112.1 2-oxoglutarate dehydrogenase E1 component [Simkaniaceae bacterium]